MCEICDADLDPQHGGGGLVTFQPDDRSREWRRRAAEDPGFVGHPPDTGWFCAAHIDAARSAAANLTFPEAMQRLVADSGRTAAAVGAEDADGEAPIEFAPDVPPPLLPMQLDADDREPDLVGVDLGSGRLCADEASDPRWVEWTMPAVDAHALATTLRSQLPTLFDALGLGEVPPLERRADRTWTPMDRTVPPWCPYTDGTVYESEGVDGTPVRIEVVLNHWNDDDVANASVSMRIGDLVAISAHCSGSGGRTVDTLSLWRPTTAAAIPFVLALVG